MATVHLFSHTVAPFLRPNSENRAANALNGFGHRLAFLYPRKHSLLYFLEFQCAFVLSPFSPSSLPRRPLYSPTPSPTPTQERSSPDRPPSPQTAARSMPTSSLTTQATMTSSISSISTQAPG